jgi:hypothetical protein
MPREQANELCELDLHPAAGLGDPDQWLGEEGLRPGDHDGTGGAGDLLLAAVDDHSVKAFRRGEDVVGERQQVGVLGGHERAHEADLTVGQGREVVSGVVALGR